jgi:hypothetical protein
MCRNRLEDLTRLLRGQACIPLEQSSGVCQRHVERSNRLRSVAQYLPPFAQTAAAAALVAMLLQDPVAG